MNVLTEGFDGRGEIPEFPDHGGEFIGRRGPCRGSRVALPTFQLLYGSAVEQFGELLFTQHLLQNTAVQPEQLGPLLSGGPSA